MSIKQGKGNWFTNITSQQGDPVQQSITQQQINYQGQNIYSQISGNAVATAVSYSVNTAITFCPIHQSSWIQNTKGPCTCIEYTMKDSFLMSFYLEGDVG